MHGLNTNLSVRSRRAFARMEVTVEHWKRATCYFEAHGVARQEDRGGMAQIHGEMVLAAGLQKSGILLWIAGARTQDTFRQTACGPIGSHVNQFDCPVRIGCIYRDP